MIKRKGFTIEKTEGKVGILTAGTSDIPVAKETGCEAVTAYDVVVAGIHRLFFPLKEMIETDVDVMMAVAGKEEPYPPWSLAWSMFR